MSSNSWISRDESKDYYGKRVTTKGGKIVKATKSNSSKSSRRSRSSTSGTPSRPPESGMVLQYTQDRSKVRYYNPDTKAHTAWRSASSGRVTKAPSSSTNLVTESYLRGDAGAVGEQSSGIEQKKFSKIAYLSSLPKKAKDKIMGRGGEEEQEGQVKYIVGRDKSGRPLVLSKGVSRRYEKDVIPFLRVEQREKISDVFKNMDKYNLGIYPVTPEQVATPTRLDKLFGTGKAFGVAKLKVSMFGRSLPSKLTIAAKSGYKELSSDPIKATSRSFKMIGTNIYSAATLLPSTLGVGTKSQTYKDGKRLTLREEQQFKTRKFGVVPRTVGFISSVGVYGLITKPFRSFTPAIRTGTYEHYFRDTGIIRGKAWAKDIRPSLFPRSRLITKATGKVRSASAVSGVFNSVILKGSSLKGGISGRFGVLGRKVFSGVAPTGLKYNIYRGIGKIRVLGGYSPFRGMYKLNKIKESKFFFKSGEIFSKLKGYSGIWGSTLTKKSYGTFGGVRRTFDTVKLRLEGTKGLSKALSGSTSGSQQILKGSSTQVSKTISAATSKASEKLLPKLRQFSTRQDISEGILKGTFGASLQSLSKVKIKDKLDLKEASLSKLKIRSKQLEKLSVRTATISSLATATKSFPVISTAVIPSTAQKQDKKLKAIPKLQPLSKLQPRITAPPIPPNIPTVPIVAPPIILPKTGSRRSTMPKESDIYSGYRKFSIPKILLNTKSFNLKMPKIKL